jgi:hypothetical protein
MWLLPPETHVFARDLNRRSFVSGGIFDSRGIHVAVVRPSGELVGHLSDTRATEKRLDRCSDRLFSRSTLVSRSTLARQSSSGWASV